MNPRPKPNDNKPAPPSRSAVWRRRILRLTVFSIVTAAFGWGALQVAIHLCPFPREELDRFHYSPEWLSADGEPLAQGFDTRGQISLRRDAKDFSPWLAKATQAVEDRRFREHNGVDWLRVARAAFDNVTHGRRVSGASTITMQLCRLMNDRPRTWAAKLDETWRALRLSRALSKDGQMTLYLNRAPYGGNRVGVEAACRAYFGKSAAQLTIGEAALIAGIPKSPEASRPDRKPEATLARRRRVLAAMREVGFITEAERAEAEREPIPAKVFPLPSPAPHLARIAMRMRPGGGVLCLDSRLQGEVTSLLESALKGLDERVQGAVIVRDLRTGGIVAWVGSAPGRKAAEVDHARRQRSPGSTLKTFVYAAAFDGRIIAPDTFLKDAALDGFSWAPRNFDRRERGDITAEDALRESLNLPAIALARTLGLGRAVATASACGLRFPADAPARSGLSWVVGGMETTLEDLVAGYATTGNGGVTVPQKIFSDDPSPPGVRAISTRTCVALDHCLGVSDAHVPAGREHEDESRRAWFMWKTGTSSGGRDAWSAGHNGRFAVGVWIGVTQGKSPLKLLSRTHAEPLIADIFSLPAIRAKRAPAASAEWWPVVRRATAPPAPRILAPEDGSTLLAPDGVVMVYPKTDHTGPLRWYLDNEPIPLAMLHPLRLGIGAHEIRVVALDGANAAVHVTVEPAGEE